MTTELLFIQAQQTLRTVAASGWDTIGYEAYEFACRHIPSTDEERLDVWKKAIGSLRAAKSRKFFSYAKLNGNFAGITAEELLREENQHIETEIEEWTVAKFRIVERVSDSISFITIEGHDFDISTDDLFSQSSFRKAFFRGTNKMLPEISRRAYQRFIEQLPFSVAEGFSQTKKEMIEDTLREIAKRLSNMKAENEAKAVELVMLRGRAVFDQFLFFKFSELSGELRQNNRPYEQQTITLALKHLGARQVHSRDGNYWIYDFKSEIESPESIKDELLNLAISEQHDAIYGSKPSVGITRTEIPF